MPQPSTFSYNPSDEDVLGTATATGDLEAPTFHSQENSPTRSALLPGQNIVSHAQADALRSKALVWGNSAKRWRLWIPAILLIGTAIVVASFLYLRDDRSIDCIVQQPNFQAPFLRFPSSATDNRSSETLYFSVIGDFGDAARGCGNSEGRVAAVVKSWLPQLIMTVGDDNYPAGDFYTIDQNIGAFYSEYLYPYRGFSGPGGSPAQGNRFFPTPGNHDWASGSLTVYQNYFTLPGNGRYYQIVRGPVHFFMIDSDLNEPDGADCCDSIQAKWLFEEMKKSNSSWKLVFFHHPPFTSGPHGSTERMRWPFALWGANAVFSGHDHTFERLEVDGIPYFVNGLGGTHRYKFAKILPQSRVRYNEDWGAQFIEATEETLKLAFFNTQGRKIDEILLNKTGNTN